MDQVNDHRWKTVAKLVHGADVYIVVQLENGTCSILKCGTVIRDGLASVNEAILACVTADSTDLQVVIIPGADLHLN